MGLDDSMRQQIATALEESYMHRPSEGDICSICNRERVNLAYHVIEYAQDESLEYPPQFVPMSASYGTVRGCFPVCDQCAPACEKCKLPVATKEIRQLYEVMKRRLDTPDSPLSWGNGRCEHIRVFGKAIF